MKVGNGRGRSRAKVGENNKKKVLKYFTEKPGSTIVDCAKKLKISRQTVAKHVREIQGEKNEV